MCSDFQNIMSKEDIILGYLTNQLSLLPSLASQYTNSNKHPHRISFLNLRRYVSNFFEGKQERLVILPGLRGVGKTTLLFQIYEFIKSKGLVEQDHLIYLTCDDIVKRLNANIDEVINVYEQKMIGEAFETHKKKIVFLIDEAHYDQMWEVVVKRLYDRSKNILIFVSGSSSIALETSTDTVRRANIERIFPLNFPEYLLLKMGKYPIKDVSRDLREALFDSSRAIEAYHRIEPIDRKVRTKLVNTIPSFKLEFQRFITSDGFPNILFDNDKRVYDRIINVLEKIVFEDLPRIDTITKKTQTKIFPILNILANANDTVPYRSFSKDIDELSLSQTTEIISALTKAGVMDSISISSGSVKKSERRSRKYYFASPSIRAAILWNIGKFKKDSATLGLLLENGIFNSLNKARIFTNLIQGISYPDQNNGKVCDFVVQTQRGKVVIECGWGNKNIEQVKKTMESVNAIFGIVVCDAELRWDKENNVVFVPKELFFQF